LPSKGAPAPAGGDMGGMGGMM